MYVVWRLLILNNINRPKLTTNCDIDRLQLRSTQLGNNICGQHASVSVLACTRGSRMPSSKDMLCFGLVIAMIVYKSTGLSLHRSPTQESSTGTNFGKAASCTKHLRQEEDAYRCMTSSPSLMSSLATIR